MAVIFGVDQTELDLGDWGTLLYAKWQHPSEQNPSPISEEEMDFWGRLIPEGSYVIDVGAYVGAVSLAMALAAGPTGLCLSFEPNPSTFKVLQTNAEWNRDQCNILPLQLAIGTGFEQKTFHYTDQEYCNGGDMS
ncbi:MAG: hypothetical protein ACWGQW_10360, partial [bacterium]